MRGDIVAATFGKLWSAYPVGFLNQRSFLSFPPLPLSFLFLFLSLILSLFFFPFLPSICLFFLSNFVENLQCTKDSRMNETQPPGSLLINSSVSLNFGIFWGVLM